MNDYDNYEFNGDDYEASQTGWTGSSLNSYEEYEELVRSEHPDPNGHPYAM